MNGGAPMRIGWICLAAVSAGILGFGIVVAVVPPAGTRCSTAPTRSPPPGLACSAG
ncbi:hypothetical protein F9C11_31725 [Amycolatopsis sp. VS8301801F10]|uniref:hypothetical protein n=1 Tax=Amycolatopsis sp. VS8301801F10 TaxID=2652442 RepID=UPI0038FD13DB